jgi:kynurenine formamidase
MEPFVTWPSYDDLPHHGITGEAVSWEAFGAEDELGTVNFMTPGSVHDAAACIRDGSVFPLNLPLDYLDPPLFRRAPVRRVMVRTSSGTDDYYDSFYPQSVSQWDGLSHICHQDVGYYNGRTDRDVTDPANPRNGIEHWAGTGIAGRFVLADIARLRAETGRPTDFDDPEPTTTAELEAALARSETATRPGDVLLLRFGWLEWYGALPAERRQELSARFHFPAPGLSPERATARWLWDHRILAVAADTPTLEAMPFDKGSFDGFLHYRLIPMLGMPVGELFALDSLASACARDGRYAGFFTSAPLNFRGGSGSTANALAIR